LDSVNILYIFSPDPGFGERSQDPFESCNPGNVQSPMVKVASTNSLKPFEETEPYRREEHCNGSRCRRTKAIE
jgi:hypothetical protein